MFSMAFNLLKPFLSAETLSVIEVYGCDRKKWEPSIKTLIDPEILPTYLGGTRVDENGDPKCSEFISYGGKIPTELYMANQSSSDNIDEFYKTANETRAVIPVLES